MKYKVLDRLKAQTKEGEMELQPGQVITLPEDKALRLIEKGKITLIGRVAYKVYSEILQAYLWVVYTDEDIRALRDQGINEPVYTSEEVDKLKDKSKEELKAINKVKGVFPEAELKE